MKKYLIMTVAFASILITFSSCSQKILLPNFKMGITGRNTNVPYFEMTDGKVLRSAACNMDIQRTVDGDWTLENWKPEYLENPKEHKLTQKEKKIIKKCLDAIEEPDISGKDEIYDVSTPDIELFYNGKHFKTKCLMDESRIMNFKDVDLDMVHLMKYLMSRIPYNEDEIAWDYQGILKNPLPEWNE